jgi:hypothetical protein
MSAKQSILGQYHDQHFDYSPVINYLQEDLTDFSKYLFVINIFLVGNPKSY